MPPYKSDRWSRVEELLHAAEGRPPELRSEFLADACGGDTDLRRDVEELLAQKSSSREPFDQPSRQTGSGETRADSLESASRLGPYELKSKIGAGGMGTVFLAVDTRLGRNVAIKMSSAQYSARFQREARTIAALNHPNICTLHDVGPDYMVMELLDGETLKQRIARGKIPLEEALSYGRQMAEALAEAHAHGIVHRDFKPANVMLTRTGLKVLDFGVAKMTGGDLTSLTEANAAMGTPAYMAPEQVRGEEAGPPADLFALGLVLYEMVEGRLPVPGISLGSALASGTVTRIPPLSGQSAAARGLDAVISRLLDSKPQRRGQDAAEVRDELRELVNPDPSGAPPPVWNAAASGKRFSRWSMAAAAVLVVALAYGAVVMRKRLSAAPPSRIRSIAVLPLENLSKDPGQQYFADGTTDALITDLSKLGALKVISLASAMRYKGTSKSLPEIARELQVDAVVEGSVIQADGRVRISARLTKAAGENSLWADNYVRDLKDVLSLQDDVARQIAEKIELTLTPEEKSRLTEGPVNPEAYQLYLQAQFAFNQDSVPLRKQAIQLFGKAIEKDPGYARAWAQLGLAYASMGRFYEEPNVVMPKARDAALKAISLDETLSEAHTALATVRLQYDWDWEGAETELKRAIQLNRSSADAHDLYAAYYTALGNYPSALAEIQLARGVDPLSLRYADRYLYVRVFFKDYDHTISEANAILATHPDFVMGYAWKAIALMMQGHLDEALESQKRAFELDPNPGMKIFMAMIQGAKGNKTESTRLIHELVAASKQQYICNYEIGQAYAVMGDRDEAFKWLNSGVKQQCDCMIWLSGEPWMEGLRADPRYLDLLKRVGFDRIPASAKAKTR